VSSCEGTTFFPSAIGGKDDSKSLTFPVKSKNDDSMREKFGDRSIKKMTEKVRTDNRTILPMVKIDV
jgi:hypothetical protein